MLAALTLASVSKLRVGTRAICLCVLGFAFSLVLFAFSNSFILSLTFLAMVGFCQIAERMLTNAAIQMATPVNLLGRVLSLFFMDRGLWSVGSVMIGTAASVVGVDWTFAACGAVCAAAGSTLLFVSHRNRVEATRSA
jgi:hypothetical protein